MGEAGNCCCLSQVVYINYKVALIDYFFLPPFGSMTDDTPCGFNPICSRLPSYLLRDTNSEGTGKCLGGFLAEFSIHIEI